MRGLKHPVGSPDLTAHIVASFTDAWIETYPPDEELGLYMSHLLQMRGLKLDK